jgi:hypothetical protein
MEEVIFEKFDSLSQFIDVIGTRKTNNIFQRQEEKEGLHSEKRSDYNWYLTSSYEESVKLATNGYEEGLDKLMPTDTRFQYKANIPKYIPSVDFVGYVPHVANAIAGVPKSMISSNKVEQRAKAISIMYSHGDCAEVSGADFVEAGKNILNVIITLELRGYRVALYVIDASCSSRQVAISIVKIKDWRQPSNPLKLAYPLLHPSYFRRQGFKWLETYPHLEDSCLVTHGSPLRAYCGRDTSDQIKFLKENGVLEKNMFYTTFNEAKRNNPDELIKSMGIPTSGGGGVTDEC